MPRLRITFAKTGQMRYTGHLDLHRTWERTIRRARLPLAYSQGFNPHPKINLASALPLGFTSEQEIIDIWLEQELPIPEVWMALEKAVPPGIQISEVEPVGEHMPSLQTTLQASDFVITLLEPVPGLDQKVSSLISASALPRERRGKDYDLRPLVINLHRIDDDEVGRARLYARLMAREGSTGRPEEVLAALGIDPLNASVHRTGLVFIVQEA